MTESSELQCVLPIKSLLVPGEKLNTVLMCHASNGAHIEIY